MRCVNSKNKVNWRVVQYKYCTPSSEYDQESYFCVGVWSFVSTKQFHFYQTYIVKAQLICALSFLGSRCPYWRYRYLDLRRISVSSARRSGIVSPLPEGSKRNKESALCVHSPH